MLIDGLLAAALLLSDLVARDTPEAATNAENAEAGETNETELNCRIVPHDVACEALPKSHTFDRILRISPDSAHNHERKEEQAFEATQRGR